MQFLGSEAFEAGEEMMVSVPQLVDMATRLWFIIKRDFYESLFRRAIRFSSV